MAQGFYTVVPDHWPLYYARLSGSLTDDAYRDFFAELYSRMDSRTTPYAAMIDVRGIALSTPTQRQIMAEFTQKTEQGARAYCVGMSIVLSSPIVRTTLTAIFWLRKPPMPMHVDGSPAAGVDWLVDQFAARGTPVPPALPRALKATIAERDPRQLQAVG